MSRPVTVTISHSMLEHVLERELMANFFRQLKQEDSPYKKGEELVVIGSGIPMIEGVFDPAHAPYRRLASDLDFYIHEPQGETIEKDHKLDLVKATHNLFKKTARDIGGTCSESTGTYPGNHTYFLHREFATDEMQQLLQRDDIKSLLRKIYHSPNAEFTIDPAEEKVRANAELHLIAYPMSFMPPEKFLSVPDSEPGKVQVLSDSTDNTLALKMARLMKPVDHRADRMIVEKATDIVDICDILESRQSHSAPPPDKELLKVLTLAHLSYLAPDGDLNKLSAIRTMPEATALLDVCDRALKMHNHQDKLARQVCIARGLKVGSLGTDEEWDTFRKTPAYHNASRMIRTTDDLIGDLFPGRTEETQLPLTPTERSFTGQLRPQLSKMDYGLDKPRYQPLDIIEDLAQAYPGAFERHPQLRENLEHSWLTRPMDHIIEAQRASTGAQL